MTLSIFVSHPVQLIVPFERFSQSHIGNKQPFCLIRMTTVALGQTGLTTTKSVELLLHLSYFKPDELLEENKGSEVLAAGTWVSISEGTASWEHQRKPRLHCEWPDANTCFGPNSNAWCIMSTGGKWGHNLPDNVWVAIHRAMKICPRLQKKYYLWGLQKRFHLESLVFIYWKKKL